VQLRKLIDTYFSLINEEAWEDFGNLWHDNAELRAVGSRPRHGRQEILEFYRTLFRPWSKHADTPVRVLLCETSATVEVRFTGVTPAGRELAFDALDLFDTDSERIIRLATWYDLVQVRKMLAEP